jgi:hypothetical protein
MERRRRIQPNPRAIILFVALALVLGAMAFQLSVPRHGGTGIPSPVQHSTTLGKEPDTADLERQSPPDPSSSAPHGDAIMQLQP